MSVGLGAAGYVRRAWGGQCPAWGGGGDNASSSAIPKISHNLEPCGGANSGGDVWLGAAGDVQQWGSGGPL